MNRLPRREQSHRLPRAFYQGDVTVAFTVCVADGRALFTDAAVVSAFLALLHETTEKHDCRVLIYCFMPDHLHMLLRGAADHGDTWQTTVEFKQRSGWWLRQHLPTVRWQKDFYDHIIRRDEDLGAQIRYIAANPIRRGLVKNWRDYPHTGAMGFDLDTIIGNATTL